MVWQAARATTVAPTFFKPIKIGNQSYIDGAMRHNDPVKIVLREAYNIFEAPNNTEPITIDCILSIGTGIPKNVDIAEAPNFWERVVPLDLINALARFATDVNEVAEEMEIQYKNIPDVYFRLNVDQGL
jgi:hypothetical protein